MTKKKKSSKASVSIKVDNLDKVCKRGKGDKCCKSYSCGGGAYFLTAIGAAAYYITTTTGFWAGVLGVLKGIVWPAFLIFELLKFLAM